MEVRVQACGRQEALSLPRAGLRELSEAVERRLEVRPPFLFVGPDGRPLADDASLAACAARGGLVAVKLTEGVLHDVSRRVDQVRHLQWGFISDQLAALKREQAQQQAELRSCHAALSQERSERECACRELRHRLDEVQELLRRGHPSWEAIQSQATPLASSPGSRWQATRAAAEVLAEVQAAQAACCEELSELRRRQSDCWQLLRRREGEGGAVEALTEALGIERAERAAQIEELARTLAQHRQRAAADSAPQHATRAEITQLVEDVSQLQTDVTKMRSDVSRGVDVLRAALLADVARARADLGRDLEALRAELRSELRAVARAPGVGDASAGRGACWEEEELPVGGHHSEDAPTWP